MTARGSKGQARAILRKDAKRTQRVDTWTGPTQATNSKGTSLS